MSDARLRELERRWKESGSLEDEAALLRERVRIGDLTRARVRLAGRLLGLDEIQDDRNEELVSLLNGIAQRPEMYLGSVDVGLEEILLFGYCHALDPFGIAPFAGWQTWIEGRFLIRHPAFSWSRILRHSLGDDRKAIEAIPGLYTEFTRERLTLGVNGIELWANSRIFERHGKGWHSPEDSPQSG